MQTRKSRISETITQALSPEVIEVLNESHQHHVPKNSQTHFKVTVVSEQFEGIPLIKRHRMINQLLINEFDAGLHALSIHAYTIQQWIKKQQKSPLSPNCLDGFKHSKEDTL